MMHLDTFGLRQLAIFLSVIQVIVGCFPYKDAHIFPQEMTSSLHPTAVEIEKWVTDLADTRFKVRQKAALCLKRAGDAAIPSLRRAKQRGTLEFRRRAALIFLYLVNAKDLREMQGAWQIESIKSSDREDQFSAKQRIVIKDNQYTESASKKDEVHFIATLKINAARSPKTMVLHVTKCEGFVGQTIPMIYKFEKGRLIRSVGRPGEPPTSFSGTGSWTVVLKKVGSR